MNRIKNSLIAIAVTLALLAIVAAFTPGTSQGQSGSTASKDVTVVNTPGVNVVNSPTVSLAEGASVGIDPARNTVKVEEPAREPLMISLGVFQLIDDQADVYRTDTFLVPEGKRLVIEHVYGDARASGGNPDEFFIRSVILGQQLPKFSLLLRFTVQALDSGTPWRHDITQPVKLYIPNPVDDGNAHGVDVYGIDMSGGPTTRPIYLAGYLEDLP